MTRGKQRRATSSRKKEHVAITLTRDVGFKMKTTGLERLEFIHNALPELNLSDVDTTTQFLGRTLAQPLMVSCMTGGYKDALRINKQLAEVCEEFHIAMGVGSQRQALEDTEYHRTFSVVREVARTIPIVGNIGAAEVARMKSTDGVQRLADLVRADAFAVHLNPLQEFLQPEGSTDFKGVVNGIGRLVKEMTIPVIVKEIGAGISLDVARRLLNVGVRYIDVAGAGGTSWAGVETLRQKDRIVAAEFWDWGIPTATAVKDVAGLKAGTPFTLMASGGIASGTDIAKCLALGADVAASARPMLTALHGGGKDGLRSLLNAWQMQLRGAMFLTGSRTIKDLQRTQLVTYSP
jgi:isopentenyl-diphosphate delta-isomerase